MTLQSSGAISLNEIHIEAGGSSGSNCSINDSDIRGLIGKGSGATMSFNEWYGASSFTAETALSVTLGLGTMKGETYGMRRVQMGVLYGATGSTSDYVCTYSSGVGTYFHCYWGSSFLTNIFEIHYNGSSSATGGTGAQNVLNGKYWRTTNYTDGSTNANAGNYALGNGTSSTGTDGAGNTTFSGWYTTFAGAWCMGSVANVPTGKTMNFSCY